ncbi:hypothetical protein [Pararhizobium sp. A13]|uniref:hypothetical protein n=1 Tax=Pararhizobium sp. A13 TaxID=3133975 RepID=UPI00324F1A8E
MLDIKFICPNPSCESFEIQAEIDDVQYDMAEQEDHDSVVTMQSRVICGCGDEPYTVEVIAQGGEKKVIVLEDEGIRVKFSDNSGDYTGEMIDLFYAPPDD